MQRARLPTNVKIHPCGNHLGALYLVLCRYLSRKVALKLSPAPRAQSQQSTDSQLDAHSSSNFERSLMACLLMFRRIQELRIGPGPGLVCALSGRRPPPTAIRASPGSLGGLTCQREEPLELPPVMQDLRLRLESG